MGATELLNDLRCAGLVLTLTPAGDLHVAPRSALTDDHRAAIRAQRDALLLALRAEAETPPTPPPRRSGNPLMTPEQGDECHAGGWSDAEIEAFLRREARFTRMGRVADAVGAVAATNAALDRDELAAVLGKIVELAAKI